MAELVAQGPTPLDRWRRTLTPGRTAILGRTAGEWGVPWEKWASGAHAEIEWDGTRLRVHRLRTAANPIFFRGEETDRFEIRSGDAFVIGMTTFTVQSEAIGTITETHPLLQQRAVHPDELKNVPFRDVPHRLDVLRKLPGVIVSATADPELYLQLVNLLLAGIPRADLIALVSHDRGEVAVLHAESRRFAGLEYRPSQRLVQEAIGRQQRTVVHVWAAPGTANPSADTGTTFTMMGNLDWAFCTPIRGESTGFGIYVAGRMSSDEAATMAAPLTESDLVDDLKFAELAADIFAALRQVRRLQRDQARLSQFFSPAVQKLLTAADPEQALGPAKPKSR